MRTSLRRVLAGVTLAAGVVMVSATASAHVTIDTYGALEQGGFGKLGFSVPNERDDAGTVTVEVQMPTDQALVFVSVQPKPGWTVAITNRTLTEPVEVFGATYDTVVDTITWTADEGVRIEPGQFDMFWVSVGPLPSDTEALAFPALQTYDSGEVVRWIEPTPAGGEEPEHPAPSVTLVAGSGDAHDAAGGAGADATGDVEADDDEVSTVAIVALVVGGLGLAAGGTALFTSRRGRGVPDGA